LVFDGTAWGCGTTPVPRPQFVASHAVASGGVGKFNSIAIGIDGFPLIAFYDQTNHVLKAAHCVDIECTAATVSTVDSTGDVGQYVSLTIATNGFGVMSYYDATNTALKAAFCAAMPCTSAT